MCQQYQNLGKNSGKALCRANLLIFYDMALCTDPPLDQYMDCLLHLKIKQNQKNYDTVMSRYLEVKRAFFFSFSSNFVVQRSRRLLISVIILMYRSRSELLFQLKSCRITCRIDTAKHAALRIKSKDWLVRKQDNESEWGDMSIRGPWLQ